MASASKSNCYCPIKLHSISDRAFWTRARRAPAQAAFLKEIFDTCKKADPRPQLPGASDFLAARRFNDRARTDNCWIDMRGTLAALALRRALLGVDSKDSDDVLLDWVWDFLNMPTWAVSAHLPGQDLPASGKPTLDLAACEMVALLAEMREVLKPWMDSVSGTLADSVLSEIDARVLTPFGEDVALPWEQGAVVNNWVGVCCGGILTACESLAAQGHPRPKARARALSGLQRFIKESFTESGECDEGLAYWDYGMVFAALGWSRLSQKELAANVDLQRLRQVGEYPRRAHLFKDCFFSGNDGGLNVQSNAVLLNWLAAAINSDWLASWQSQQALFTRRHFSLFVRALEIAPARRAKPLSVSDVPQFLSDQQVGILRANGKQGQLLAYLTGGHNGERHNHNDLGHFGIAVNERFIIPDLGAPHYQTDFFGPRRYTYISASSRGHCCPLIGKFEQRPGREAAGKVLEWSADGASPRLRLDLTAAYPPEAGLLKWERALESRAGQGGMAASVELKDLWQTRQATTITHVIWSVEKPQKSADGTVLKLGPLQCQFSKKPQRLVWSAVKGDALLLRDFAHQTLYRIEAIYRVPKMQVLEVETHFARIR